MAGKKHYSFGEKKFLRLVKDNVVITDGVKDRKIDIPAKRWKSFNTCFDEIDSAVLKLSTPEQVALKIHIGGAWYLSVTSGFPCIDLRRFYVPRGTTAEKPMREGLTIKISEWPAFKQAVLQLHTDNPKLTQVLMCTEQIDHLNQLGALGCQECFPFAHLVFGATAGFQ